MISRFALDHLEIRLGWVDSLVPVIGTVGHMSAWQAWGVATLVILVTYSSRYAILRGLGQAEPSQLLWLAPLGLITVPLLLTASQAGTLGSLPFGAVMLIVLTTAALTGRAHRVPGPLPASERVPE